MRTELEKRRLQLENLSREKELVSQKLARAEKQLELIEGIRSERDDLLSQLESQDQAGQRMAASFESLLERLANESRRGGRRPTRDSDSGPPRGAP
jgi:seryl-tRNA synthetase